MSIKKLFSKNKAGTTTNSYLSKSAPGDIYGIESTAHLSESVKKNNSFLAAVDYADPENFVKYGSAEKYYQNAFDYISGSFPYDGSSLEITKFYNDLNPLEQYIYNDQYPKSTGYVVFGTTYGTPVSNSSGYYSCSVGYLETLGGPHKNTVYSTDDNRTSNLAFGGPSGSSVEFFLKKDWTVSQVTSSRETILDVWNGNVSSSVSYGRFTISLDSTLRDRFFVTMQSGTDGFYELPVPTTGGLDLGSNQWSQYSFVFDTSGSATTIDFYQTGSCVGPQIIHNQGVGLVTGTLISNLGALRSAPSGVMDSSDPSMLGWGKLSGSVDEFRFWKSAKNPRDIGANWFTRVYGGADKYDANVDLGVYYRFNEGITEDANVDKVVLDYSGRISNGLYKGYTAESRLTASALDEMNLPAQREDPDPIVRSENARLTSTKDNLVGLGREYDYSNTSRLMNSIPDWIREEDSKSAKELESLTQIMSSYFDTLHSQITELSKIKQMRYVSGSATGSINEFPHNERLLEGMGFETSELFANASPLAQFLQRNENFNFEQDLPSIKNSIYKNIYNNLTHIYKAKGNEKAIRNLIRCYGIGDDIISLNVYADNQAYDFNTEYNASVASKKYLDFTGLSAREDTFATVYQYPDPANSEAYGIISGSGDELNAYAFTLEAEFIFPDKSNSLSLSYYPATVDTASLFGYHTPVTNSYSSTDTAWAPYPNDHSLQVVAIRSASAFPERVAPLNELKDVCFAIYDRAGTMILSSSVFKNVYDNQKWNFALSVRPTKYPFAESVEGTILPTGPSDDAYTLEFYGVNYDTGMKNNSFYLTSSINKTSGSNFVNSAKRIYMGSHRTNFSGGLITPTDIRGSSVLYWTDYIPTGTVDLHAREVDSFGRDRPFEQAYTYQATELKNAPQTFIPKIETLALNWDFSTVTGSDSSGVFYASDFSSGSLSDNHQGSLFANINSRQHTAKGEFFATSSHPAKKEFVYTDKPQLPEYVAASDMINILDHDVEVFKRSSKPVNYYFSLENSMYRNISERMIQLFASVDDMNNLVGEPVNQYRPNYKAMEKLRTIFFNKVGNIPDLQKYLDYYKWVDSAMGDMLIQLFPASSRHSEDVRVMVESHILERPKYHYHFLGNKKTSNYPGPIGDGVVESLGYTNNPQGQGWRYNHAPVPLSQDSNAFWWKIRAERDMIPLSQSAVGFNADRSSILAALQSQYTGSQRVYIKASLGNSDAEEEIIQQEFRSQRAPASDFTFGSFQSLPQPLVPLLPTTKRAVSFRATLDGVAYEGRNIAPFNAVSSSVTTGYRAQLVSVVSPNVDFTNLHKDNVITEGVGSSMQGPFTNQHVGGLQARHQNPMSRNLAPTIVPRAEQYNLNVHADAKATSLIEVKKSLTPATLNGETLAITINGVVYSATFNSGVDKDDSTKTVIGVADCLDEDDVATAILNSINLSISGDSLPVTAAIVVGASNVISVTATDYGPDYNANWSSSSTDIMITSQMSGGAFLGGSLSRIITGSVPKGQYLRGAGPKSPLNITNIKSYTGSISPFSGALPIGNYKMNYEVVQTNDRALTNMDFVFNNSNYYTGSIPTAFLTTPSRRAAGLTGSVDYAAPRQIATRRTNQTIIVNRFAAPGSKLDSKQQFRDIPSDQVSPNSALPFRNQNIRRFGTQGFTGGGLSSFMSQVNQWGGFVYDIRQATMLGTYGPNSLTTIFNKGITPATWAAVNNNAGEPRIIAGPSQAGMASPFHKVQRNTTRRIEELAAFGMFTTGTVQDNNFVTRPIPQADRSQWFMSLSGSDPTGIQIQNDAVLSGSRYPSSITYASSSLSNVLVESIIVNPGTAASGSLVNCLTGTPGKWNTSVFTLIDAAGTSVDFEATTALAVGVYDTSGMPAILVYGCNGLVLPSDATAMLANAFNYAAGLGAINIVASQDGSDVTIDQASTGTAGNTTISVVSSVSLFSTINNFTGGTDSSTTTRPAPNFSPAIVTGTNSNPQFIWGDEFGFFPATQLLTYGSRLSRFRRSKNEFLLPPVSKPLTPVAAKFAAGTLSSSYVDRARNTIETRYSARYIEPVITSKYKPLTTKIKTFRGTPSRVEFDQAMAVDVKYSYGNDLQGFANKGMNIALGNKEQYQSGLIKRPYEVFRDTYISDFDRIASGMDLVHSTVYPETIYPKEIYTYATGSRSRLAFQSRRIWSPDQPSGSVQLYGSGDVAAMGSSSLIYSFLHDQYIFSDAPAQKRFSPRFTGKGTYNQRERWSYAVNWEDPRGYTTAPGAFVFPRLPAALWTGSADVGTEIIPAAFMTSQDYRLRRSEQTPWNEGLGWSDSGLDVQTGRLTWGTGSVWPLDTYPFWTSSLDTSVYPNGSPSILQPWVVYDSSPNSASIFVEFAAASSLPCGELLMPHYGNVILNLGTNSQGTTTWSTSSLLSAQYVYTIPTQRVIDPTLSSSIGYRQVEPRSPGGPYTRPEWSAGKKRRIIDGERKYQLTKKQYPFYESYEKFIEDAKLISKDQTIIPEFRISNHLPAYQRKGSVMGSLTDTLELTGAYATGTVGSQPQPNPNSSNADFLARYSTSDLSTYLPAFMKQNSTDVQFNKNPRQLKVESKATVQLLPYEGFYPVNRTMQLAALFSQSYGPYVEYSSLTFGGAMDFVAPDQPRWRTLLRPYYAPGILYNSIKSGLGVSYPVGRTGKNQSQFDYEKMNYIDVSMTYPMNGPLTGTTGYASDQVNIPGNRRRRVYGAEVDFDFQLPNVNGFFWGDVIKFESILDPLVDIGDTKPGIICTDNNVLLWMDITASVDPRGPYGNRGSNIRLDDTLYRASVSNFLAAVPEFFLKEKEDGTYMTKFIAEVPQANAALNPGGNQGAPQTDPRTMEVFSNTAYIMEIGLKKTDRFNMYSNPFSFGIPTGTGSYDWSGSVENQARTFEGFNGVIADQYIATTGSHSTGIIPPGGDWPKHRAEFAPFTPAYYYGTSVARIIYMPQENKRVTLADILNGGEVYVEYTNENDYMYDFASGSFSALQGRDDQITSTTRRPAYGWNRAWQNRQDIDDSIVIDNQFPSELGTKISPLDKNKWVIMPKWECPALDFRSDIYDLVYRPGDPEDPIAIAPVSEGLYWNFSSSLTPGLYTGSTHGMWHQYGVMPENNEGVYLYIADVDETAQEFKLLGCPVAEGGSTINGRIVPVRKVPNFVLEASRSIDSLASLVGFNDEEIMPSGEWIPERAKRIGELAPSGEKTISEAILAMPYYLEPITGDMKFMSLRADARKLGPKIKEFRRAFTKYSLPPALRKSLEVLLPPNYPDIPDYINPFGGDGLDEILSPGDITKVPSVYLMEHSVTLSRQDLGDMWQNIMPELSTHVKTSVAAIDHYMPGGPTTEDSLVFPEILAKQIELGVERDGFARPDLIDTTEFPDKNGFIPEIQWLVFKVKQRGPINYTSMMLRELNGGPAGENYETYFGAIAQDLPPDARRAFERRKNKFTKKLYHTDEVGAGRNTYNWPYDYCSLVETAKIDMIVGFRPEIEREPEADVIPGPPRAGRREAERNAEADSRLGDIDITDLIQERMTPRLIGSFGNIANIRQLPPVIPSATLVPIQPIQANLDTSIVPSPVVSSPVANVVNPAPLTRPALQTFTTNVGRVAANFNNVGRVGNRNVVQRQALAGVSRVGAQAQAAVGRVASVNRGFRGGGYGL